MTDEEKAELTMRLVGEALRAGDTDGDAAVGAMLRELQQVDPEAVQRLAAGIQLARAGLRLGATAH